MRTLTSAPREIIGYHGCSRAAAERVIAGEPWLASQNRYDWLGQGIYFWEYAPYRALEWAEERYGEEGVVLRARIRLGRCLNLMDRLHFAGLSETYATAESLWESRAVPVPINTARGAHFLDRHVIDAYCLRVARREQKLAVQTVRGCFPEGDPLYPGSKILTKAHVQVAVRDANCIVAAALVQ